MSEKCFADLLHCLELNQIVYERNDAHRLVLIDEVAQLQECESAIPLHLPGVQNVVLVGDERQLPSMVQSKVFLKNLNLLKKNMLTIFKKAVYDSLLICYRFVWRRSSEEAYLRD